MRRLLTAAVATVIVTSGLSAQTVYNTFGPGNSFNCCTGWTISSGASSIETSYTQAYAFLYGGAAGAALAQIRLAAGFVGGSGELDVTLLDGTDIGTASMLEAWSIPNPSPDFGGSQPIYVLTSVTPVSLNTGDTYWVQLSTPEAMTAWWAWNWNDQGIMGNGAYSEDDGATWLARTDATMPAFAVDVGVVPEPGTMTLLATGLVGLVGISRRRKRA